MRKTLFVYLFILFLCYSAHANSTAPARACIIAEASKEIGVRELTGRNDGHRVEYYLATTGLSKGHAWCAAFINAMFKQCGLPTPEKAAWSPSWFPSLRTIYRKGSVNIREWQAGDVFGIYFTNLKRIAHVGIIKKVGTRSIATIEGNTNDALSREGDGVYEKWRLKSQIHAVSDWTGTNP